MDRIEFGRYLAARRKELGIKSLEQMAGPSGISRAMLQRLETGGTPRPSARMVAKIASAYKIKKEVAEEVFLKGDGEDDEECRKLDGLLGQIARDKSFSLKDHAARSLSECKRAGKHTKIYLIKAYEKITGKKLL
jgi:transcriptional regulator with XRE-family HTH domain